MACLARYGKVGLDVEVGPKAFGITVIFKDYSLGYVGLYPKPKRGYFSLIVILLKAGS